MSEPKYRSIKGPILNMVEATEAERSALAAQIARVEARCMQLWETVSPTPHAQPGSYERGRQNGVADTLRAIEAALVRGPKVYPDGWRCKYPRSVGSIAQDCGYPDCDCNPGLPESES